MGTCLKPAGDARTGQIVWQHRRATCGSLAEPPGCILTARSPLDVLPVVSFILFRSSLSHPASFGLGSEGSAGHTSPVVGTKGADAFGLGTSGHADTHHRSGCAVRRGRGQAVALHRGFAPIRDLAAPRHALRWPCVGGCGWSCPRVQCGQGVWRRVAHSRPSVTVRGLLWGAYVAVFRRCTGALPSPCRSGRCDALEA